MKQAIRTFVAVAVLTITIWIWADLELQDQAELTVPVEVVVPPDIIVTRVEPERLRVRILGARWKIQELLRQGEGVKVARFSLLDPDLAPGQVVLDASEGFQHWAERGLETVVLGDSGLGNADVRVDLDREVRIPAEVEVRVTGATVTATAARPPRVTAICRQSLLESLPDSRRIAVARLTVNPSADSQTIEREVNLEPRLGGPDGIEARFEPPIVQVTVVVESAIGRLTLPPRQIQVAGPFEALNTYAVIFQDPSVLMVEPTLEGPRRVLEQLNEQQVRVELVLTPEDRPAEGTWIPRQPRVIGLPAGVKVISPLPTVNFNLVRRPDVEP